MSNGSPDPDDFFSETRMTFGDHLEDLRRHLWRAVAGFGVATPHVTTLHEPFRDGQFPGLLGRFKRWALGRGRSARRRTWMAWTG